MPKEWMQTVPVQSFYLRTNAREAIAMRTKKMLQLARYARVGVPGEMLGWDDVEVVRFNELHRGLADLDRHETPLQSFAEDFL